MYGLSNLVLNQEEALIISCILLQVDSEVNMHFTGRSFKHPCIKS